MYKKHLLEIGILLVLAFGTILFTHSQFIIRTLATPSDKVYLGTVHYPSDYFYYLSQFVQGKTNVLRSTMLFTPESLTPVFIGWQSVLTGRVLSLLGIPLVYQYQIAVFVFLSAFLFFGYLVIRTIFPIHRSMRILAFLFFTTSNALFKIVPDKGTFHFSYYYYWYNTGNAQVRFGATPHHLLGYAMATLGIYCVLKWFLESSRRRLLGTGFIFVGITLGSINPVHWGLLTGGVAIGSLFYVRKNWSDTKLRFFTMIPSLLLFAFGLPVALYAKYIYSTAPYSYSAAWEARQWLRVDLYWLFVGSGLVIPFAIWGIIAWKKKSHITYLFPVTILAFCSLFYFTTIPDTLHITQARFWPTWIYIFWSVFAAEGAIRIAGLFGRFRRGILVTLILLYIVSLIPTYFAQIQEYSTPQTGNGLYYISNDTMYTFEIAEKISRPESAFLVQWPFNEPFAALTGRKVLFGFYLLTINAAEKSQFGLDLIDGKLSPEEAYKGLRRYGIDYIMVYPWNEKVTSLPFLEKKYSSYTLGIYEVK